MSKENFKWLGGKKGCPLNRCCHAIYYVKWTIIDMDLKSNRLLTGNTLTSIRESRLYRR
jgi:hypothetical protein